MSRSAELYQLAQNIIKFNIKKSQSLSDIFSEGKYFKNFLKILCDSWFEKGYGTLQGFSKTSNDLCKYDFIKSINLEDDITTKEAFIYNLLYALCAFYGYTICELDIRCKQCGKKKKKNEECGICKSLEDLKSEMRGKKYENVAEIVLANRMHVLSKDRVDAVSEDGKRKRFQQIQEIILKEVDPALKNVIKEGLRLLLKDQSPGLKKFLQDLDDSNKAKIFVPDFVKKSYVDRDVNRFLNKLSAKKDRISALIPPPSSTWWFGLSDDFDVENLQKSPDQIEEERRELEARQQLLRNRPL